MTVSPEILVVSPLGAALAERLRRHGLEAIPLPDLEAVRRLLEGGEVDALVLHRDTAGTDPLPDAPDLRFLYAPVEGAGGGTPGWRIVAHAGDPFEAASLYNLARAVREGVAGARDLAGLRESEALHRRIVEAVNEGIRVIDRENRVTYVNPHGAAMLGYSPEELLGEIPSDYIVAEDMPQLAEEIPRHERGEAYHFRQIRIRRKDGSPLWIAYNAVPIIENGAFDGSIAMFSDVSALKEAEELLRERTAELEAAYRRLALISAVTRHDIGNELLSVEGYLRHLAGEEATPRAARLLEGLVQAVERVRTVVGFMRDYQAIGALPPVWLDLRATAERAIEGTAPSAVIIENCLPRVEILAAPLIEKVIANLIENALRHGSGTGRVRLSACVRGTWFRILVEDDGAGIPADEKGRVFSQAYGRNTGYGLFFVREALESMGMTISETAEPGEGARFEISLPCERCRSTSA